MRIDIYIYIYIVCVCFILSRWHSWRDAAQAGEESRALASVLRSTASLKLIYGMAIFKTVQSFWGNKIKTCLNITKLLITHHILKHHILELPRNSV